MTENFECQGAWKNFTSIYFVSNRLENNKISLHLLEVNLKKTSHNKHYLQENKDNMKENSIRWGLLEDAHNSKY